MTDIKSYKIKETLQKISFRSFCLNFIVDSFTKYDSSIIWIKTDGISNNIVLNIRNKIIDMPQWNISDRKHLSPHVTMFRVKKADDYIKKVHSSGSYELGKQLVPEIKFKSRKITRYGSVCTNLQALNAKL